MSLEEKIEANTKAVEANTAVLAEQLALLKNGAARLAGETKPKADTKAETPKKETKAKKPKEEPKADAPAGPTDADMQKVCMDCVAVNKREEIVALINEFGGAGKAGNIPVEKWPEFYKKAQALAEGEAETADEELF